MQRKPSASGWMKPSSTISRNRSPDVRVLHPQARCVPPQGERMSLQEDFGGLLSRARKMCGSCPFRLRLTKVERQLFAAMPPDEFPCHTEDGYMPGSSGIQC